MEGISNIIVREAPHYNQENQNVVPKYCGTGLKKEEKNNV